MGKTAFVLAALAAVLAGTLAAQPARAQSRVFVAAQGSDGNPCTFAQPCRTFQHAHDFAEEDAEIDVLDAAGYGALTITKGISIQGHGFAGVSATGGRNGITINAPATGAVNLNGLLIEGGGTGGTGILFNSGKSLVVANCMVRNMTANGLQFLSSTANPQTLAVSNSTFADNALAGIILNNLSAGVVTATIERSGLYRNFIGLNVNGTAGTGRLDVMATNTVASANANGHGFLVQSLAGHSPTTLVLLRSTSSNNFDGVEASGTNATLRLAQSSVWGNNTGFTVVSGAAALSYGDNSIDRNGGNTGTLGNASKE
jgi:hypothetical protein